MTTTVLKLSDSDAFLKTISIKTIKDVRALDVDLLLVLTNGDSIIISSGAITEADWRKLGADSADGVSKLIRIQSHNTVKNVDSVTVEHRFTIDTVAPVFTSNIRLEQDTGAFPDDKISANGKVLVPAPKASDKWRYSIDGASVDGDNGNLSLTVPKGRHTVTVTQYDAAGNTSSQTETFEIDTDRPAAPIPVLAADTGDSTSDRLTNNGRVNITGLETAPGTKWQYSLSSSPYDWKDGDSSNSVNLNAGPDGERRISVRQTDVAGNTSAVSAELVFTLKKTRPTLTASLAQDTGDSTTDLLTRNGTVNITGLEPNRAWQYSSDGGSTWSDGPLSSSANTTLLIPGDAAANGSDKVVVIRQTDAAGNEGRSPSLPFRLDTVAPTSVSLKGGNFVFESSAATPLSLKSVSQFFANNTDVYRYSGSSDRGNNYDISDIRLLYEVETSNPVSKPTLTVRYDAALVRAGDVMAIYEGDKLLASRTLGAADNTGTLNLTVDQSLAPGAHTLVTRYTSASGKTSQSGNVQVTVEGAANIPSLSGLKVKGNNTAEQAIGPDVYTSVTDLGNGNGAYDKGLVFSGVINAPQRRDTAQKYLVSISLGGKVLAFDTVEMASGSQEKAFSLTTVSSALPPGFYKDLAFTVTNVTEGSRDSGLTTAMKNLSMGWYWAAQSMGGTVGGHGDDNILLSATTSASAPPFIRTGAGKDTLTLGAFGKSGDFSAAVEDFQLGVDKIAVAGQTITRDNYAQFARSASHDRGRSTTLVVDLDGSGPGTQTYTLELKNVPYNPLNTPTIFGV